MRRNIYIYECEGGMKGRMDDKTGRRKEGGENDRKAKWNVLKSEAGWRSSQLERGGEFMNECKAATSSAPEIPRREGGIPGRRGKRGGVYKQEEGMGGQEGELNTKNMREWST